MKKKREDRIPEDDCERPLYGKLLARFRAIALRLHGLHYLITRRSPNLFCKYLDGCMYFADLRARTECFGQPKPDPAIPRISPLVFFVDTPDRSSDYVEHKKGIVLQWRSLVEEGLSPHWLSYPDIDFYLTDATCWCGKRYFIEEEGWFGYCSRDCMEIEEQASSDEKWSNAEVQSQTVRCFVCGRSPSVKPSKGNPQLPLLEPFDFHHIDYAANRTILVCKRCHGKITRKQNGFEGFFSVDSRIQKQEDKP